MRLPQKLPRCAICGGPVARLDVRRDMRYSSRFVVEAFCHGDVDRVEIDPADYSADAQVEYGEAFATKRLARPQMLC